MISILCYSPWFQIFLQLLLYKYNIMVKSTATLKLSNLSGVRKQIPALYLASTQKSPYDTVNKLSQSMIKLIKFHQPAKAFLLSYIYTCLMFLILDIVDFYNGLLHFILYSHFILFSLTDSQYSNSVMTFIAMTKNESDNVTADFLNRFEIANAAIIICYQ